VKKKRARSCGAVSPALERSGTSIQKRRFQTLVSLQSLVPLRNQPSRALVEYQVAVYATSTENGLIQLRRLSCHEGEKHWKVETNVQRTERTR